jgi:SAM-dependent methyltransferase
MSHPDLATTIEALRPWQYNHYHEGQKIINSDRPEAGQVHDNWGKPIMEHLAKTLAAQGQAAQMRVLDMGCLEGHYTDIWCAAGFGEVVGVDLSTDHIQRARLLLETLRGYPNLRLVEGDVMDMPLMQSLGKFDVVIFHGLLYHLTDPLLAFELLDALLPAHGQQYLLLSTQYKFDLATVASRLPLANLNLRNLKGNRVKYEEGKVLQSGGAFRRYALRLNPAAVHKTLGFYGYQELIAYDTPDGTSYSYNSNHLALRQAQPGLLAALQSYQQEGVRFYPWDGRQINGLNLDQALPSSPQKPYTLVDRARDSLHYRSGRLLKKLRGGS